MRYAYIFTGDLGMGTLPSPLNANTTRYCWEEEKKPFPKTISGLHIHTFFYNFSLHLSLQSVNLPYLLV